MISFAFVTPQYKALEHLAQVPRLADVAPQLQAACWRALALGQPFVIGSRQGVPPCLLGPFAAWSDLLQLAHEARSEDAPQKLKVLREHALIESAVSSSRIEGVEVDKSRIGTLMFGKPTLRDRYEEEVRGYRDALRLIHQQGAKLPITEATIKKLHKLSRGEIWDAGVYKEKDVDIIPTFADGRSRVRFKTLPAKQTPKAMAEMIELWQRGVRENGFTRSSSPRR